MKKVLLVFLIIISFLLVSCVSGGGGGEQQEISQPRDLTMFLYESYAGVVWEVPEKGADAITKYQISFREASQTTNPSREVKETTDTYATFTIDKDKEYFVEVTPVGNGITKSATLSTQENTFAENIWVEVKGTLIDSQNDNLRVESAVIQSERNTTSNQKGEFSLLVNRSEDEINITHGSYQALSLDQDELESLLGSPFQQTSNLNLYLNIIQQTAEIIPEEEATLSDENNEMSVKVPANTFDELVNLTLSSNNDSSSLKSVKLTTEPVAELKNPIQLNVDLSNSNQIVNSPNRTENRQVRLGEALRALLDESDLDFYFAQYDENQELWNKLNKTNYEFDQDTLTGTLSIDQTGIVSLRADIEIPIAFNRTDSSISRGEAITTDGLDMAMDIFSKNIVDRYFGNVLIANYNFVVYDSNKIIRADKVLQKVYLTTSGIKPVFSEEGYRNNNVNFENDLSALSEYGYDIFIDTKTGTATCSATHVAEDDADDFFSKIDGYTILKEMQDNETYLLRLEFTIKTPFGLVNEQYDVGTYQSDGSLTKPPTPSNIIQTQSYPDKLFINWEASEAENFKKYVVAFKSVDKIESWREIMEITDKGTNQATITVNEYSEITDGASYAVQIITHDDDGLLSRGEVKRLSTTNVAPDPVNLYFAFVENKITAKSVHLAWDKSTAHDFQKYVISYEAEESDSSHTREASQVEIAIRNRTDIRISGLTPETTYTFSIQAFDDKGEASEERSILVTTVRLSSLARPTFRTYRLENESETEYRLTLYWMDNSPDNEGYKIKRDGEILEDSLAGDDYKYIDTLGKAEFGGRDIEYEIIAYNGALESSISEMITIPDELTAPDKPVILNMTPDVFSVDIDWQDVKADSYKVYLSLNEGITWSLRDFVSDPNTILENLQPETAYWLKIKAENQAGESEATGTFTTLEQTEATFKGPDFEIRDKTYNSVRLRWVGETGVTGYYIIRDVGNTITEEAKRIEYVPAYIREYVDTKNIVAEETYTYSIVSYSSSLGDSESNSQETVTIPQAPERPEKPTIIFCEYHQGDDEITIRWSIPESSSDPTLYKIKRVNTAGNQKLIDVDSAQREYVDLEFEQDATYTYSIAAQNQIGDSDFSDATRVYIPVVEKPPTKPQLRAPANGALNMPVAFNLIWSESTDPNNDFSHYELYLKNEESGEYLSQGATLTQTSTEVSIQYDKTYDWWIVAVDEAGNRTRSDEFTFATMQKPIKKILGRIESGTFNPNQTGKKVPVIVQNAKGLKSGEITIKYDNLYFENVDIQTKNNSTIQRNYMDSNTLVFTFDASVSSDEVEELFEITFDTKELTGLSWFTINTEKTYFKDFNDDTMSFDINPASMKIERAENGEVELSSSDPVNKRLADIVHLEVNGDQLSAVNRITLDMAMSDALKILKVTDVLEGCTATVNNQKIIFETIDRNDQTFNEQQLFKLQLVTIKTGESTVKIDTVTAESSDGNSYRAKIYGNLNFDISGPTLKLNEADASSFRTVSADLVVGEEVSVKASLADYQTNMKQLDFNLQYDPAMIQLVPGSLSVTGGQVTKVATQSGIIEVTVDTFSASEGDEMDVVNATFLSLKTGDTYIDFDKKQGVFDVDETATISLAVKSEAMELAIDENAAKVYFEDDKEVTTNSTFTYDIYAKNIEDFQSMEVIINYDDLLTVKEWELQNTLSSFETVHESNENNRLKLAAGTNTTVDIDGDEVILSLIIEVKNPGIANVLFDPATGFMNGDDAMIPVNFFDNGKIIIK